MAVGIDHIQEADVAYLQAAHISGEEVKRRILVCMEKTFRHRAAGILDVPWAPLGTGDMSLRDFLDTTQGRETVRRWLAGAMREKAAR